MLAFGANAASATTASKTLLPAFTCTAQCSAPPSAISAPSPESKGRWGERTVAANADLNADGINDVWVADPFATVGTTLEAGKVYLVSGASLVTSSSTPTTPNVIYTLTAPTPVSHGHFGFVISNIGDVNGDAKPDLAVGVDANDPTTGASTGNGNVWVYDGTNAVANTPIYTIDNPTATSGERFGSRIGKAGDIYNTASGASGAYVTPTGVTPVVTGDGKSEIIVGASKAASGAGVAYIFDGNPAAYPAPSNSSSTTLPNGTFAAPNGGSFGLSVQGPGDFNGDGVPDLLISAPAETVGGLTSAGAIYVYSGYNILAAHTLLQTIHDPVAQAGAFFGFQDVTPNSPGDVNTDGKADIYAEGWKQNVTVGTVTTSHQGEAWVFAGTATAGTTNTPLLTIDDKHPHIGGQFGWSMTSTTKGNTPTPVMLIGASPHDGATTNEDGGAYLYTSSTGAWDTDLPLPQGYQQGTTSTDQGPNLGWTVSAPGKLDAANPTYQTYVAGAPFVDNTSPTPPTQDEGLIFTFWGPTYAHAYCEPTSTGAPTGTCV